MRATALAIALAVVVPAKAAFAQADAPPWTACTTAYQSGGYDAAALVCTNAEKAFASDEHRAREIVSKPPPYAPDKRAFLFDRGIKALQIHYYSAMVARKRGDDENAERSIREAAIWGLNLSFVLQRTPPKQLSADDKTYAGVIGLFLQSINQFEPGLLQSAVGAPHAP